MCGSYNLFLTTYIYRYFFKRHLKSSKGFKIYAGNPHFQVFLKSILFVPLEVQISSFNKIKLIGNPCLILIVSVQQAAVNIYCRAEANSIKI